MAKKGGFNPFGGLFDFNRDGKTDFGEQWLAMKIFEECTKEDPPDDDFDDFDDFDSFSVSSSRYDWRDYCNDGSEYGVDPDDYETEDEYNEALTAAKYAWRDTCEDGFEFSIDPDDYETEDEYNEALVEAKTAWRDTCEDDSDYDIDPDDYETEDEYNEALASARNEQPVSVTIPLSLSFSVSFPGQEALDAIKEADYPNKRKYNAAYHLCDVKQGTAYISDDSSAEEEIARCEFILNSDTVAAKYLTVFNGYLFAQAVKENFTLPIDIPDEDEEVLTYFDDLILELAEEDTPLAVKVWSWCIKEFGPYRHYMTNDWTLYNGILSSANEYPPEFVGLVVKEMAADPAFLKGVLEENLQFPVIAQYISYALEKAQGDLAAQMFRSAIAHPAGKGKDFEELIDSIISYCSNWDELETMEAFKFHVLPVIEQIDDKRIQRLLPKFKETVDTYIHSVEASEEKYQYSRRFAWRKNCVDGSAYDIDPLDYETEAEYNAAILQEKYGWRRWHIHEAERYKLDLTAYETEADFEAVVEVEKEKEREATRRKQQERRDSLQRQRSDRAKRSVEDPLMDTDKTVYTFCGVIFQYGSAIYHYRTDDDSLSIGDLVIVPVGNDGKEAIAEIVTVEKHRRKTAPYPVDMAKFIKIRYVSDDDP